MNFQFRGEAFNVFNHPSANTPNAVIGHDSSAVAPTYLQGLRHGDELYAIPGTLSSARVLSLTGKLIF
jgi:hypothetical protein